MNYFDNLILGFEYIPDNDLQVLSITAKWARDHEGMPVLTRNAVQPIIRVLEKATKTNTNEIDLTMLDWSFLHAILFAAAAEAEHMDAPDVQTVLLRLAGTIELACDDYMHHLQLTN
jgi:hypothetical protein